MSSPRLDRSDYPDSPNDSSGDPQSVAELRLWIRRRLALAPAVERELLDVIGQVVARQRQLMEESKNDALRALTEGVALKLERLQHQVTERDLTVINVSRYFEDIVATLSDQAHRDAKTRLFNFAWFMERIEAFLGAEQRVRWCAVGVVDIASFKWYNDTLGHPLGDRVIERVAAILADQIRSEDYLAIERSGQAPDLHARFGGDEFCFLIPDLPGCTEASIIAGRFKRAVDEHDWVAEDSRLAEKPVCVDVGVVCLRLGPLSERRGVARALATDLIHRADALMYKAKASRSPQVHAGAVRIADGVLVDVPPSQPPLDQASVTIATDASGS